MQKFLDVIYIIIFLFLPNLLYSQNNTAQPHEPCEGEGQVLRYSEFSLQYAAEYEQPYWVAYVLEANEINLPAPITRTTSLFKADSNIEAGSSTLADFKNSGYDRGHLSRAEYNKRSATSYKESFLLSNISPQVGIHFNQTGGLWYRAEEFEIELANQYGKIYGVSGPVFINNLGRIGTSPITVPGFFYKVITYQDESFNWISIGLLLPHRADKYLDVKDCIIPIHLLESLTGLDFNCFLPVETQSQIEYFICLE